MQLPSRAQVDSASRHAISIAATPFVIFGLQSKGITLDQVKAVIGALGSTVNDIVVLIGAVAPFYAMIKAMYSATQAHQIATVQSIATGPASDVAVSAQKALVQATSAIANDKSIPASEDAKNMLIAATI